ncbi:MAG: PepSY domain-containing protein [Eubacteriales bacterium]|nr:PepSY domain-containing protein [Eubacteriales bacterium]
MKIKKMFTGRKMTGAIGAFFLFIGAGAVVLAAGGTVDAAGAEELALMDAGVSAEEAERLRTETEREDGENVYEVSFQVDGIEYEYLIREADGEILEWEIDGRNVNDVVAEESLRADIDKSDGDKNEAQNDGDTLIGMEEAKNIALSDEGVTEDEVVFSTLKYEKEHRRTVYKVEFYQGNREVEYEIDAYSGDILEVDRD